MKHQQHTRLLILHSCTYHRWCRLLRGKLRCRTVLLLAELLSRQTAAKTSVPRYVRRLIEARIDGLVGFERWTRERWLSLERVAAHNDSSHSFGKPSLSPRAPGSCLHNPAELLQLTLETLELRHLHRARWPTTDVAPHRSSNTPATHSTAAPPWHGNRRRP